MSLQAKRCNAWDNYCIHCIKIFNYFLLYFSQIIYCDHTLFNIDNLSFSLFMTTDSNYYMRFFCPQLFKQSILDLGNTVQRVNYPSVCPYVLLYALHLAFQMDIQHLFSSQLLRILPCIISHREKLQFLDLTFFCFIYSAFISTLFVKCHLVLYII